MIDIQEYLDGLLSRISIDMDYSVTSRDPFGDLFIVFNPDYKFSDIKSGIMDYPPLRNKIIDTGNNFLELCDTIYIDGNRTCIGVLLSIGNQGFGTQIKIMVKYVDYSVSDDGRIKRFLSFASLKSYKDRNIVDWGEI